MRLTNLEPHEEARLLPQRPVLVAHAGSIAHGLHRPPADGGIDDVDIVTVYIPDLAEYFGPGRNPERGEHIQINEWDCSAYEIRHFAHLLLNANPNVVSTLWVPDSKVLLSSWEAEQLRANRHLFSSLHAYHSFSGYAHSQLKRMQSFHEATTQCCAGEKFHTPDCQENEAKGRGSAKRFATGYMGAKRKALVEKHGYDTKNAAHLIRLLKMGREFLETGTLRVDRTDIDREELLAIKDGKRTLAEVKAYADYLFTDLQSARTRSVLPDEPDRERVTKLLVDILSVAFNTKVSLTANAALARGLRA